MQEWPKMQQWPVWCGVKNTFGMLVHSKEYAFPVLSVNSRIVLPNKEWDLLGRAPVSRSNNYNVFLMSVLPPPPLGSVLSQINLFHTFKLFVSKIDFNIIPPFVPNFPSGNFLKFCGPVVVLFFFKYCTIALVDGRVSLTYFQQNFTPLSVWIPEWGFVLGYIFSDMLLSTSLGHVLLLNELSMLTEVHLLMSCLQFLMLTCSCQQSSAFVLIQIITKYGLVVPTV